MYVVCMAERCCDVGLLRKCKIMSPPKLGMCWSKSMWCAWLRGLEVYVIITLHSISNSAMWNIIVNIAHKQAVDSTYTIHKFSFQHNKQAQLGQQEPHTLTRKLSMVSTSSALSSIVLIGLSKQEFGEQLLRENADTNVMLAKKIYVAWVLVLTTERCSSKSRRAG